MGIFPGLSVFPWMLSGFLELEQEQDGAVWRGKWAVCSGRLGQRRNSRGKVGFLGDTALVTPSGARAGRASAEPGLGGGSDSHHGCHRLRAFVSRPPLDTPYNHTLLFRYLATWVRSPIFQG